MRKSTRTPGSLITDNKTALKEASPSIVPQLIGTWNTVNETNANMGNTHMNNIVGTSGKITFYVNGWEAGDVRFNQTINDHTRTGMWMNFGNTMYPCYDDVHGPYNVKMIPTTISDNHIELQDSHDDTIRLMRNG